MKYLFIFSIISMFQATADEARHFVSKEEAEFLRSNLTDFTALKERAEKNEAIRFPKDLHELSLKKIGFSQAAADILSAYAKVTQSNATPAGERSKIEKLFTQNYAKKDNVNLASELLKSAERLRTLKSTGRQNEIQIQEEILLASELRTKFESIALNEENKKQIDDLLARAKEITQTPLPAH